jgi:hypothetical protein
MDGRIAVTLDQHTLVEREKRDRLARELGRLDQGEEQRLAEEGLGDESWPKY